MGLSPVPLKLASSSLSNIRFLVKLESWAYILLKWPLQIANGHFCNRSTFTFSLCVRFGLTIPRPRAVLPNQSVVFFSLKQHMPPRTRLRRAAAQKQKQYRIDDDSDDEEVPASKNVGGVLASLSHNVPSIKTRRNAKKGSVVANTENKLEVHPREVPEEQLRTPPPVKSVVVGHKTNPVVSPLANSRRTKTNNKSRSSKTTMNDEISAISCDINSFQAADKSVESNAESDDDKTLEMQQDHENGTTTDKSEDSDSVEESEQEDSGEDSFELESEDLDGEEFEPDDDDYVPDEEENSNSEDDEFEDIVEQDENNDPLYGKSNKRNTKNRKLRSTNKKSTPEHDRTINEKVSASPSHDSAPCDDIFSLGQSSLNEQNADDTTEIEETPMKKPPLIAKFAKFSSPEPQVAMILDCDDCVDDDDVLVATILEEEIELAGNESKFGGDRENAEENMTAVSLSGMGERDSSKSICTSQDDARYDVKEDHNADKILLKDDLVVTCSEDNEISVLLDNVGSLKEELNPQVKRKDTRKSFFRQDGIVKRGKWTLGTKIGVGSFGSVHVGMNSVTGKLMAVKVFTLDGAVMKDLRNEIDLMRTLEHRNIVRYLGAQIDKTHLRIFQEWVPGGSVATLLSRFGPFALPVIRSYLLQTLCGLAYLHDNNIMHRDIKGSNILVNDDGVVKLADFGASKKLTNLRANLLMSLTVRGTPYFMAPEVFEEKYSAKADIWGIGCVAYQMMTGSPPWKENGFSNPISLFNHIKKHNGTPPLGDANKERLSIENCHDFEMLQDLLNRCFAKDPDSRPTVEKLQIHPFFTEVNDTCDEESIYSRNLFSPANTASASIDSPVSPAMSNTRDIQSPSPSLSRPSPPSTNRSKSVVKWKQTFLSPPRPRRGALSKGVSPVRCSPQYSPQPQTSEWPDWARAELQKRNLFCNTDTAACDAEKISQMMGSLALSEDSGDINHLPFRRMSQGRPSTIGTTGASKLFGLSILDDSNPTVEI